MLDAVPTLYLAIVALFIGFAGLMWSADRFVGGAASIASGFGIKPMIIGLTVVSFGTSAPEIMVSINASLEAAGDMAVGNAIGSNIANIAFVLGATTLVAAIPVQKHLLKNEMPVLLLITGLAGFMLYDGTIVFWEGALLLTLLVPSIWYLIYAKSNELNPAEIEAEEDLPEM
ncbi:MAG: calcium/sodium antiporter, partial [Alteromonadaceae bacterium]